MKECEGKMEKIIDKLDKAVELINLMPMPENAGMVNEVWDYIASASFELQKCCPKIYECRDSLRKEIEGKFLARAIGTEKAYGEKSEPITIGKRRVKDKYYQISILVQEMGAIEQLTSRWETPEQYLKRRGEPWPDDWSVYALYESNDGQRAWFVGVYKRERLYMEDHKTLTAIVCATEAGKPPNDWKPDIAVQE